MTQISFPGLGIAPFTVDPIAFSVFGVGITWYGLLITTGMVLAFFYCMMRAKQEGVKSDDIIDLAIVTIILAILGIVGLVIALIGPQILEASKMFIPEDFHGYIDNIVNGWPL